MCVGFRRTKNVIHWNSPRIWLAGLGLIREPCCPLFLYSCFHSPVDMNKIQRLSCLLRLTRAVSEQDSFEEERVRWAEEMNEEPDTLLWIFPFFLIFIQILFWTKILYSDHQKIKCLPAGELKPLSESNYADLVFIWSKVYFEYFFYENDSTSILYMKFSLLSYQT